MKELGDKEEILIKAVKDRVELFLLYAKEFYPFVS